ncbi:hypothetical protein Bpfe_031043 [Biomphalaria pfeifferi]|uniref:Uncharacterized protein n=1 Tax=Biomphalaria pfeifferi TaxID=112525 RepID=A0AAD8EU86_BIOPF|nr:hypothetical protein Bpfe_031043 [Biomphalaria pfeifferi]
MVRGSGSTRHGNSRITRRLGTIQGTTAAGTHSGTIALTTDQFCDIKAEWNESGSTANFKLEWQSPSQPREVVPQDSSLSESGSCAEIQNAFLPLRSEILLTLFCGKLF